MKLIPPLLLLFSVTDVWSKSWTRIRVCVTTHQSRGMNSSQPRSLLTFSLLCDQKLFSHNPCCLGPSESPRRGYVAGNLLFGRSPAATEQTFASHIKPRCKVEVKRSGSGRSGRRYCCRLGFLTDLLLRSSAVEFNVVIHLCTQAQ